MNSATPGSRVPPLDSCVTGGMGSCVVRAPPVGWSSPKSSGRHLSVWVWGDSEMGVPPTPLLWGVVHNFSGGGVSLSLIRGTRCHHSAQRRFPQPVRATSVTATVAKPGWPPGRCQEHSYCRLAARAPSLALMWLFVSRPSRRADQRGVLCERLCLRVQFISERGLAGSLSEQ